MKADIKHLEFIHDTLRVDGNPKSPFWFMGLEEGTGDDSRSADEHIHAQYVSAVDQQENGPVEFRYARKLESLQATFAGYIKLLLSVTDAEHAPSRPWTKDDVFDYQRNKLGCVETEEYSSCLVELFPLPRHSHNDWLYGEIASRPELSFLASPATYASHALAISRGPLFIEKVKEFKPRVLFCFGADGRNALSPLINSSLIKIELKCKRGQSSLQAHASYIDTTLVIFSYHPGRFLPDDYWRELGQEVVVLLNNPQSAVA